MSCTDINCPCVNCILIAKCRHKYFAFLKNDCELVEQYLYEGMVFDRRRPDFDYRIYQVYLAIKPTEWYKKGATFGWKKLAYRARSV